jgi:CDP-glucose 4,6-dehydratase
MTPGERYKGKRVLVTGAQGFIGCWLAERLLSEGADVVAPCRDVDPTSRFRTEGVEERCQVIRVDVADYRGLLRILKGHAVNAVFHLAAQPIVGQANRSPLSTYESNVRGCYTLLEACRVYGERGGAIERIVVASTAHAYGRQGSLPHREQLPLEPTSPHNVSKACADMIARCYATTYGMPVAITRLANTFGGGDRNWSRIVPDAARSLVRGERPVIRSDGTPERDYLYVEDAVEAYLAIADSLDAPELRGRAWNVSPGQPVSVLELVRLLIAVSGEGLEPEVRVNGRPGRAIDRQYCDSSRIREELGWSPKWTLEDGLRETYAWYKRSLVRQGATVDPLGAEPRLAR